MSIRLQSASSREASSGHPGTANAEASRSNNLATTDVHDSAKIHFLTKIICYFPSRGLFLHFLCQIKPRGKNSPGAEIIS